MALLKFISLSVGSLMLLQGAYAEITGTAEDKTQECLPLVNKARTEVGLPSLKEVETDKNYLTHASTTAKVLKAICGELKDDKPIVITKDDKGFNGGTAAYARKIEECSAAVDEWKKGFSAFKNDNNSLPGAFTEKSGKTTDAAKFIYGQAPYDALNAVNFVALYNGQTNATVECSLVTCTGIAEEPEKSMVCMTYPAALTKDGAPYDEAQWKGILNVFAPSASSASAAVPTVLALAAAAVGVALI